jgi:DNA-binding HxlR family transcriptional regulator
MAKWPGYQRFCSLARALDVVGERWTLLIVQEISFQPTRYNELRRRLPGIGSNILADRLRKLEEHGIVQRVPEGIGQGVRYVLTERGRGLIPAIVELRTWGLGEQLMLECPAEVVVHDLSYGIPDGLELSETYQWDVDGTVTTMRIEGTTLTQTPGPADDPAVVITTTRDWMRRLVAGRTDWRRGRASGEVAVVGSDDAWERMLIATAQPGADATLLDQPQPEGRPPVR